LPALYSLTSLHSPSERRGGMIAIASSMTILGNMLGPILGGLVAGHYGIRQTFLVNSTLMLAVAYLVWKKLADVQKQTDTTVAISETPPDGGVTTES